MTLFKTLYGKLWDGIREIIIKMGLYDFAHKVYAEFVILTERKVLRQKEKRENGWEDKRYIKIKEYHNKHEGKRCFVVATGPSLTIDDVNKLTNEYTFSMNSVCKIFDKTVWRPTYYMIVDPMVLNVLKNDPQFKSIQNKFMSSNLVKRADISESDIVFPQSIGDFLKYGAFKNFSGDCYGIVYCGNTVVCCILQLAVYMGFKEIYLIGCDCNFSSKQRHFSGADYNPPKIVNDKLTGFFQGYEVAKDYCDAHGIKIYNATRGGKLEVFERVDFDSLFEDKT